MHNIFPSHFFQRQGLHHASSNTAIVLSESPASELGAQKSKLDGAEANEKGTLAFAVLEDKAGGKVRTVEVYTDTEAAKQAKPAGSAVELKVVQGFMGRG